jgi:hypothetical protein
VQQEQLAHRVFRVFKVFKEKLVLLDLLVLRVLLEQQVHRALREILGILVLRDQLV